MATLKDQDFELSKRIAALYKSNRAIGYFSEAIQPFGGMGAIGPLLCDTPHGRIDEMPKEFLAILKKAEEMAAGTDSKANTSAISCQADVSAAAARKRDERAN